MAKNETTYNQKKASNFEPPKYADEKLVMMKDNRMKNNKIPGV